MTTSGDQERAPSERESTRQPDQAEGEREGEPRHPAPEEAGPTPSQAEGDPETVDASISEHEQREGRG